MSLIVLDQKTPTKKFLPQKLFQSPLVERCPLRYKRRIQNGWAEKFSEIYEPQEA